MGYQTQKILELNQEEQRPIGVIRGAILINDSGQRFFQLKLKNNLPYTLQQVQVQIVCYNEDGMYIGAQNYTYQSLSVEPGEVFGTKQAIPVEFESTDSFSVIGEEMGEEPEEDISGELKDIWEEEQSSKRNSRYIAVPSAGHRNIWSDYIRCRYIDFVEAGRIGGLSVGTSDSQQGSYSGGMG